MRTLNFRDYVLWPIAYKLGLDPTTNFNEAQGSAIGTYINAWVRRLYTSADWPEWEVIDEFTPIGHFVPYTPITSARTTPKRSIGKVLSVHLIDPRTTNDPVDIPFTESEEGVHVGFDHGTKVWIRYLPYCPLFTANPWNANKTFRKGEVTYSPTSGECYVSKLSGNRNHDPGRENNITQPLVPETIQTFVPPSPGFDAVDKIVSVFLVPIGRAAIEDTPPLDSTFTVFVTDSSDAVIASQAVTADGAITLTDVLEALRVALVADVALAAFTITSDPDTLSITFRSDSDFNASALYSPLGSEFSSNYSLQVLQRQTLIPATAPTEVTPQKMTLTLADEDVRPDTEYTITFFGSDGVEHVATYVATKNDGAAQILAGLVAEIQLLGGDDPVMGAVGTQLDGATNTLTLITMQELGVDVTRRPPLGMWWTLQPFPFELIDPVIRGANADTLKEWGQSDKGAQEEQAVPSEAVMRLGVGDAQQFNQVAERTHTKSRYVIR